MTKAKKPLISLIAARAANGAIGKNGMMAWHIPEDLKYFKSVTLGKPVIMGRKTYQSIGKPLPGRHNIVLTRDPALGLPDGVTIVTSFDEALAAAGDVEEIMVIGGGAVYDCTMGHADRLYITEVEITVADADSFFPKIDENVWTDIKPKISRQSVAGNKGRLGLTFRVLERR